MGDELTAVVVARLDALTELCRVNFEQVNTRLDKYEAQTTERLNEHAHRLHELEQYKAREEGAKKALEHAEGRDWTKHIAAGLGAVAGAIAGVAGSGTFPH